MLFVLAASSFFFIGNYVFSPEDCGGYSYSFSIAKRDFTFWFNQCGIDLGLKSFYFNSSRVLIGLCWVVSTSISDIYDTLTPIKFILPKKSKYFLKRWALILFKVIDNESHQLLNAIRALKIKGLDIFKFWRIRQFFTTLFAVLKLFVSYFLRMVNDLNYLFKYYSQLNPYLNIELNENKIIEANSLMVKKGEEVILRDIKIDILRGTTIGLIGKDNSGKSSLLKTFNGYIPYANQRLFKISGNIKILGLDSDNEQFFDTILSNISLVSSDVKSSFIGLRVKHQLMCLTEDETKAKDTLNRFGLGNFWERNINSLSGGETIKLMIVCSIIKAPQILLFDDITTPLDAESKSLLLSELEILKKKGTTIIVCDNDMESFHTLIDKYYLLENGRISPLSTLPLRDPDSKSITVSPSKDIVLMAKKVSVDINGKKLIENLDLKIYQGDYYALTGNNGVGKTTLANVLAGIQQPTKGQVTVRNGKNVGYVFQNPFLQVIEKEVQEELLFGTFKRKLREDVKRKYLDWSLSFTQLERNDNTLHLHSSQLILLEIAVTSENYDLIILDEPTFNMDEYNKMKVVEFIQLALNKNIAVIVITHDNFILSKSSQILTLKDKTLYNDNRRNF